VGVARGNCIHRREKNTSVSAITEEREEESLLYQPGKREETYGEKGRSARILECAFPKGGGEKGTLGKGGGGSELLRVSRRGGNLVFALMSACFPERGRGKQNNCWAWDLAGRGGNPSPLCSNVAHRSGKVFRSRSGRLTRGRKKKREGGNTVSPKSSIRSEKFCRIVIVEEERKADC